MYSNGNSFGAGGGECAAIGPPDLPGSTWGNNLLADLLTAVPVPRPHDVSPV
jgi:hypothetical protein